MRTGRLSGGDPKSLRAPPRGVPSSSHPCVRRRGRYLEEPPGDKDVHREKSPGHQDWLNCVRSRKRPLCDVEVGARSVTVCHLGNLAYWNRRRLRWDPEHWHFVGDEEASRWLDRERRDPWQLPEV